MKKLRPKNPLFLAVIEEAQVPSMAIITGFCHDRLPTTDSAFESLSNRKSHRPSSYRIKGESTHDYSIVSSLEGLIRSSIAHYLLTGMAIPIARDPAGGELMNGWPARS
jgi:hypothetical protein